MRDILEELYFGRLRPYEQENKKERSEILIRLTEQEEELVRELIPSQQMKLRAYLQATEEMHCDTETECFYRWIQTWNQTYSGSCVGISG